MNNTTSAITQPFEAGVLLWRSTAPQHPDVFAALAHSLEQCYCLSCWGSNCVSQIGHTFSLLSVISFRRCVKNKIP
jgi:hypothetical protein